MAATPAAPTGPSGPATPSKEEILAQRKKYIGYNVAVNYSKMPLYIVRGRGQYLFDEEGKEYLDCVNNVCHVGHCHPAVVAAITDQVATLNTNSRYLSPYLTEYARRLTATMPDPLRVCFWVNSGSEANDLALRLARAHTKKRGVMCVEGAYHGHLTSIIDISPYKYAREGGAGRRSWVREAPAPDVFSGKHRGKQDDDAMGAAYAGEVDVLLDDFAAAEKREATRRERIAKRRAEVAAKCGAAGGGAGSVPEDDDLLDWDDDGLTAGCGAFIMESILSCGGQILPPPGYLRRVYKSVRAAGGVTIADEVQVGFGRVGSKFWAFQLQGDDVVPDIVTLGKPMGDGFPVAMVVTTPAIAASFNNGMEYFNTYGGNPPAARVALAVLDTIEKEGLQAHAAAVGEVLLDGFRGLEAKYGFIGSVRGVGLMVGLEVIRDRAAATREAWSEGAYAVSYAMRKRCMLVSVDGMTNNIIKLKPPMVFTADNARAVIAALDDVMAHLDEHLAAYKAL